ncbi:hypothetical protein [Pseudarthrobacter polychromogenes]|uniref:Uncharacterized protein n=1 Tax=Pseudarthrobacter polychromogenes TaxID=1676 RepID=A0ABQ1X981_9MICC|nr:hypothetical protein [Pseudarthrobacter polychromogenes]GGG83786.1 hypothetical protein GCM10011577_01540 [Pseudarthrobacter polychromogenes]
MSTQTRTRTTEAIADDIRKAPVTGGPDVDLAGPLAHHLQSLGYRKPKVIGYIVVDRGGIMVGHQHKHRESAQAFADEWSDDCKTAGIHWEYRVAEIVETAK